MYQKMGKWWIYGCCFRQTFTTLVIASRGVIFLSLQVAEEITLRLNVSNTRHSKNTHRYISLFMIVHRVGLILRKTIIAQCRVRFRGINFVEVNHDICWLLISSSITSPWMNFDRYSLPLRRRCIDFQ